MATRQKSITPKQELSLIANDAANLHVSDDNYRTAFYNVEEYVRTAFNKKELKKETLTWYSNTSEKNAKLLGYHPEHKFLILGKLCFILNRGGELDESAHKWMEKRIDKMLTEAKDIRQTRKRTKKKVKKFTIQDYLQFKAHSVAGEYFESEIDRIINDPKYKVTCDPLAVMVEQELSQGHARYILKLYHQDIAELKEVLSKTGDKALKKAYNCHTKKQIRSMLKLYESIHSAADMIIAKAKTTRKSKTVKPIDMSKRIAKVKYLKQYTEFGLVSESPIKLLGATEAWVYNTKTRKIGKYVSEDSTGFDVKGTTIRGISVEKSIQKNLRKPKQQIRSFKTGGTRKLNNAFKAIKAVDIKLTGRMNEHTVILRIFK